MSELAEASGVSAGTIKHYLREGLLPEPVKTSRNMAYYPPEFVERIRLIKQLQEERFMPLKLIKGVLDEDPERAHGAGRARGPHPRARAAASERSAHLRRRGARRYEIPQEVLDRLERARGADARTAAATAQLDVEIIEAICRFRAGGYDERIGFTVYDTLRYKRRARGARQGGGRRSLLERLAGEVEPDRAVEMHRRRAPSRCAT